MTRHDQHYQRKKLQNLKKKLTMQFCLLFHNSYRIMREIFRFLVCSFGVLNMRLCILWHWVVLPLSIGWNLNRSGVEVMKNSSLCMLSKTVIVKVNWKYLFILTSDKDKLCSMRKIKELQLCIS
jgi:hypothetical protein